LTRAFAVLRRFIPYAPAEHGTHQTCRHKGLPAEPASEEATCLNNSARTAHRMSRLRGNSAALPPCPMWPPGRV